MRRLAILSIAIAYFITTSAANAPAPFPSSGELATFATSTPNISPGPPVTVTAEVLETLTVAAQRTPCPGPPRNLQREAVSSSSYQHTLFCLSWDALGSGELASARGEVGIITFTASNGGGEMGGRWANRDLQATPPLEGTGSGASTPSIPAPPSTGSEGTLLPSTSSRPSSSLTADPPQPQTTSSLLPTINILALESCFHPPSPSPSSSSSFPLPNCNALLTHISTCHDTLAPWTDPYDSAQSAAFQACMCQTAANIPFGPEGEVWRNFSACAECLTAGEGGAGVEFGKMTEELER